MDGGLSVGTGKMMGFSGAFLARRDGGCGWTVMGSEVGAEECGE